MLALLSLATNTGLNVFHLERKRIYGQSTAQLWFSCLADRKLLFLDQGRE